MIKQSNLERTTAIWLVCATALALGLKTAAAESGSFEDTARSASAQFSASDAAKQFHAAQLTRGAAKPTSSRSLRFEKSRCSELEYVQDHQENANYLLHNEYSGGEASWDTDGLLFSMEAHEMESDVASRQAVFSLDLSRAEKDASGRIVRLSGNGKLAIYLKGDVHSAERKYESTREYASSESSEQYTETSVVNGAAQAPHRVSSDERDSGTRVVVTRSKDEEFPEQHMTVTHQKTSCAFTKIDRRGANRLFAKDVLAFVDAFDPLVGAAETAVQRFDACSARAGADCSSQRKALDDARAKRDERFLALMEPKDVVASGEVLQPGAAPPSQREEQPVVSTVVIEEPPSTFSGPSGDGCSQFGSGLSCGAGRGSDTCSQFGNGWHCSGGGGVSVCTPFGSHWSCTGSNGTTIE